MQTLDILKAARKLISDPERWTQGAYARDSQGDGVGTMSPLATCFCSLGALAKVTAVEVDVEGLEDAAFVRSLFYLNLAAQELHGRGAHRVNDNEPHQTVLEMFDFAISQLETGE